jgi:hypothetical protein
MSVVISVSLSEEANDFLSTLKNKSEYIQEAIDDKRGKSEQSIQDLEISVNSKKADYENEGLKLMAKIDQVLQHKDDLKLSEIKSIKDVIAKKDKELLDFMNLWSPILDSYEEIKNFEFKEGWDSVANLNPIIDIIRKNNIRIGFIQLRDFLYHRKKTSSEQPIQ